MRQGKTKFEIIAEDILRALRKPANSSAPTKAEIKLRDSAALQHQAIFALGEATHLQSPAEFFRAAGSLLAHNPKLIGAVLTGKAGDELEARINIQMHAVETCLTIAKDTKKRETAFVWRKRAFDYAEGVEESGFRMTEEQRQISQQALEAVALEGDHASGRVMAKLAEKMVDKFHAICFIPSIDTDKKFLVLNSALSRLEKYIDYVPSKKRLDVLADAVIASTAIGRHWEGKMWELFDAHSANASRDKVAPLLRYIMCSTQPGSTMRELATGTLFEYHDLNTHGKSSAKLQGLNAG